MAMTTAQAAVLEEIVDDARYVAMRATRLVVSVLSFTYTIWFLIASFANLFKGFIAYTPERAAEEIASMSAMGAIGLEQAARAAQKPTEIGYHLLITPWHRVPVYFEHYVLISLGFLALSAVLFMVYTAAGTPYRYESVKPGLDVHTCEHCGVKVADTWKCEQCHRIRFARFATLTTRAASWAVTFGFIVWDVGLYIVGFLLMII